MTDGTKFAVNVRGFWLNKVTNSGLMLSQTENSRLHLEETEL